MLCDCGRQAAFLGLAPQLRLMNSTLGPRPLPAKQTAAPAARKAAPAPLAGSCSSVLRMVGARTGHVPSSVGGLRSARGAARWGSMGTRGAELLRPRLEVAAAPNPRLLVGGLWGSSAHPPQAASPAPGQPGLSGASFPLCSRLSGSGGSPSPTEAPNSLSPGQDGPRVRASLGWGCFTSAPGATADTPRLGDKQGRCTYSSITWENEAGAFPGKQVAGGGRRGRDSSLLLGTAFQQRSLWTSLNLPATLAAACSPLVASPGARGRGQKEGWEQRREPWGSAG